MKEEKFYITTPIYYVNDGQVLMSTDRKLKRQLRTRDALLKSMLICL